MGWRGVPTPPSFSCLGCLFPWMSRDHHRIESSAPSGCSPTIVKFDGTVRAVFRTTFDGKDLLRTRLIVFSGNFSSQSCVPPPKLFRVLDQCFSCQEHRGPFERLFQSGSTLGGRVYLSAWGTLARPSDGVSHGLGSWTSVHSPPGQAPPGGKSLCPPRAPCHTNGRSHLFRRLLAIIGEFVVDEQKSLAFSYPTTPAPLLSLIHI